MTNNKESHSSLEELILLFKQKKNELQKIKTDIETVNVKLSEILKALPRTFSQVPKETKEQCLALDKQIKNLEILECDEHESLKQLAIKIGKKKKLKEQGNGK